MNMDPEKKYHRWQVGHLLDRIEPAPTPPGSVYRVARVTLHHRFFIAGYATCRVDMDIQLLINAADPERLFRREAKFHGQALRLEAARIRRKKIRAWFTRYHRGVCRECGCTDDQACPGGCAWVDTRHTLCSRCAEEGEHTDG
jgi:hypothetical protein